MNLKFDKMLGGIYDGFQAQRDLQCSCQNHGGQTSVYATKYATRTVITLGESHRGAGSAPFRYSGMLEQAVFISLVC